MNVKHKMGFVVVGIIISLMGASVAYAFGNTLIPSELKTVTGCGNVDGDEVCITVTGTYLRGANGSSHKAWFVKEGSSVLFKANGENASGSAFCNAKGDNGTLKVRGNVQKAGKQGGGLYAIGAKPVKLQCEYKDTVIEVKKNSSAVEGVSLIPTEVKTLKGELSFNDQTVVVQVPGTSVNAQNGSSHKAFAVDEGAPITYTIDGNSAGGSIFCTAVNGVGNGTLKVRGNVQKAGKQGGGMFVQASSSGKLLCVAKNGPIKGASLEIK